MCGSTGMQLADDRVSEESREAADKMAESRAAFARAAVARASAHVSRAEERIAILDRAWQPYQQTRQDWQVQVSKEMILLGSLLSVHNSTKRKDRKSSACAILDREASQAALDATQATERAKVCHLRVAFLQLC